MVTSAAGLGPARASLASSLIGYAERIGVDLIAEGIETRQELDTLRTLGIRRGQGLLLGPPGPLATVNLEQRQEPAAGSLPPDPASERRRRTPA